MDENHISQKQRNTEIIINRQKNTIGYSIVVWGYVLFYVSITSTVG